MKRKIFSIFLFSDSILFDGCLKLQVKISVRKIVTFYAIFYWINKNRNYLKMIINIIFFYTFFYINIKLIQKLKNIINDIILYLLNIFKLYKNNRQKGSYYKIW